jgi:hypothetical protein
MKLFSGFIFSEVECENRTYETWWNQINRFALVEGCDKQRSRVDTYLCLNQKEEKVFRAEVAKMGTVTEQEQIMEFTTSWMEKERLASISSLMELCYGAIDTQLSSDRDSLMTLTAPEYNKLLIQLSKQELIEYCNSAHN